MERRDKILIVEDLHTFRAILKDKLCHLFDIMEAPNAEEAERLLSKFVFDAILLDIKLNNKQENDGIVLLKKIKTECPMLPVIMMTGYGNIETAVEAMKMGADDFIDKMKLENLMEYGSVISLAIKKNRELLQVNAKLAEQQLYVNSNLVGNSKAMKPVRDSIALAASDGYCSVLILGETGTGKEVIARSIHEQGWRKDGQFIAVSITGLNPSLLESELFGHEKGAFTGADKAKTGYIELANGGTLFLDEIGELSAEVQGKLLRFLEDKKVYKVGSTNSRPVDLQIIYATNRDLKKMVTEGKFRNDLYFRIKTIEIVSPPLHERTDDIRQLAMHFLEMLKNQGRTKLPKFSDRAMEALSVYYYPGNVRELKQIVEWSVLLAGQNNHWEIEYDDLPNEVKSPSKLSIASYTIDLGNELNVDKVCAIAEIACVERALKLTKGQKNKSETLLGYNSRQTMRRRIQKIREAYPDIWVGFPIAAKFYDSFTIENE